MVREVQRIAAAIPHRDLALQWDVCIEMIQWDGRTATCPTAGDGANFPGAFARLTAPVPPGVELGFHLCYGDMDAKHFVEPIDLGKAVELANLIIASSSHAVKWIHVPVPADRDDADYFQPLANLKRGRRHRTLPRPGPRERRSRGYRAPHACRETGSQATSGSRPSAAWRARTPEVALQMMKVHAEAARALP